MKRQLGIVLTTILLIGSNSAGAQAPSTYTNPTSKDFADTFADPALIKAKDGYWYAYGTTDPLREGERRFHFIPTARSHDLVNWEYVGDAFTTASLASWAEPDAGLWAPDIRYFNGRYYLYYVVTETRVTDERSDGAIGVATAPSPTGPWTDSGSPLVGPRRGSGSPGDFKWTFDPSQFTDNDGTRYLYYGSYYGGIFVTKLSSDGLRTVGEPTMVAIDNRYEGSYVVRRGRFYYLFASAGNCCAGPTTGYSVYVGRATSPAGPFVDREGVSMLESRVGGTHVIAPNGNRWVGPGHNAIATDLSGQDYFVYHAIDRDDPFLDEPFGINERPMLMDRLDWVDGWPSVRGGRWSSDEPQPAPVTEWTVGSDFSSDESLDADWTTRGWHLTGDRGRRRARTDVHSCETHEFVSKSRVPADVRVEGDVRLEQTGRGGLLSAFEGPDHNAATYLDSERRLLVTRVVANGASTTTTSPLPRNFAFGDWHTIAVEIEGTTLEAEVSDARLGDALSEHSLELPAELAGEGRIGAFAECTPAEADNLGAAPLAGPAPATAPDPLAGAPDPAFGDEFDDGKLGPQWSWVRSPAGQEQSGEYVWPTQNGDLYKDVNSASVLLRDAPPGDYTVETKLEIDLGTDDVRNYQQAGLIVYDDDDLYTRLVHVAIWNTRQTEFGKEMPWADGIAYGASFAGPPAEATWLRIAHRTNPATGERRLRAASSRDGEHWIWGGVWTLPADSDPRIGLISMGGEGATARFDYFRVRRP